jgi:hypothetical protein
MGRISEHESSHAILALAGKVGVVRIALGEHPSIPRSGGFIVYGTGGSPWARCVSALAGEAAELVFRSIAPRDGTPDYVAAMADACRVEGVDFRDLDQCTAVIGEARALATELVKRHRDVILHLASELDRLGELNSAQIGKIVGSAIEPAPSRDEFRRECEWRQERVRAILERRSAFEIDAVAAGVDHDRDAKISAIMERRAAARADATFVRCAGAGGADARVDGFVA